MKDNERLPADSQILQLSDGWRVSISKQISEHVTAQLRHVLLETEGVNLHEQQTLTLQRPGKGVQRYAITCIHCRPNQDFVVAVASLPITARVRRKGRWLAAVCFALLVGNFAFGFRYAATLDTAIPGILLALSCCPLFGFGVRFMLESFWKGIDGAWPSEQREKQIPHTFM